MFSFRRKPARKGEDQVASAIRSSPSLPELYSQGIPWPENLLDPQTVASIRETPPPGYSQQGATRSSLHGNDQAPIPFHKPKPLWTSPGTTNDGEAKPISSLYMSHPPSAFNNRRSAGVSNRPNQRRTRQSPTFNLMVVGGRGTGKTSLLRLLLETADISPTATNEQRAAMDKFVRGKAKRTQSIQTACVEICESRFERLLFSVIDTPGLEFAEGREFRLERQVSSIIRYLDAQYADTMNEESKVVRQSKGDQHVHLCIYMVDPSSIMSISARRAQSSLPLQTRSETTISHHVPNDTHEDASDDDDDADKNLTMSPAEIRVIRRLSARANVLPVIARADSLTDDRLSALKATVRRDLADAGLNFGVFGPAKGKTEESSKKPRVNGVYNGRTNGNGVALITDSDAEEDADAEERQSRPIIKLRPSRHANTSRSRSRRERSEVSMGNLDLHDLTDSESVANVRFSARIVAKTDLSSILPFALIAPEETHHRRNGTEFRPVSVGSELSNSVSIEGTEEAAVTVESALPSPINPSIKSARTFPGPPEDLKGIFTRNFRWGSVDVLDPNHCDFAALRTAVLSTHLKLLKIHTREVLYEKYRTEKLLVRRATHNISNEDRERLLEELGLPH